MEELVVSKLWEGIVEWFSLIDWVFVIVFMFITWIFTDFTKVPKTHSDKIWWVKFVKNLDTYVPLTIRVFVLGIIVAWFYAVMNDYSTKQEINGLIYGVVAAMILYKVYLNKWMKKGSELLKGTKK